MLLTATHFLTGIHGVHGAAARAACIMEVRDMTNQAHHQTGGHRTVALRAPGPAILKSARTGHMAAAHSVPAQHAQPSAFSALVQDFIDDCGYSDK